MTDEEIISLLWERSDEAIPAVEERLGAYCYRIAYNILGDEDDARECVNDAYYKLWQAVPPDRPESLTAFLGKITRNIALNRYKQAAAQKRGQGRADLALSELEDCIPTVVSIEQGAEDRLVTACIEAFLTAQPKQKRVIFLQRYWYLCSIREIAQAHGISEAKAKSLLFRMRKELRNRLDKEGIEL